MNLKNQLLFFFAMDRRPFYKNKPLCKEIPYRKKIEDFLKGTSFHLYLLFIVLQNLHPEHTAQKPRHTH